MLTGDEALGLALILGAGLLGYAAGSMRATTRARSTGWRRAAVWIALYFAVVLPATYLVAFWGALPDRHRYMMAGAGAFLAWLVARPIARAVWPTEPPSAA